MSKVLYVEPADEIADLIQDVRETPDQSIALVLPQQARVFQSPLHLRLLAQFAEKEGKRTAIVSGDPRIQELSKEAGFPTYASIQAFERGIEIVRPHASGTPEPTDEVPATVPSATAARVWSDGAPAATGTALKPAASKRDRYRPYYVAAIALGVVALLLYLVVGPSAQISVTLAATPLNVSPTVQGSTDPGQASQGDHILTQVVSADASGDFMANPTGTQTVPATAASGTVVFTTALPFGVQFSVPKGEEFDTGDNPPIKFVATQDTQVSVPGPSPPNKYGAASNAVPVQDTTPEARGNVAPNTITKWPQNPCTQPPANTCAATDLSVSNPAATSGGADEKKLTVASDDDVAHFKSQVDDLKKQLHDQVEQSLAAKASGRQIAVDAKGGGKTINDDVKPALPQPGAQFAPTKITVSTHGKATTYNSNDLRRVVETDLKATVAQGEQLATDKIVINQPSITEAGDDGTLVLAVNASAFSKPNVDLQGLKGSLTGKSPDDARKLIRSRLGSRVRGVDVSQTPFGLFFLPLFSSRIELDENIVADQKSSG
ncbi:MAG TPA: hypothetical protein VE219_04965 [Candidatus Sulfotelmatobacter sp.]|nr:hypothetical protein [Candidatus Sulfotelmatobacter sp.]